MVDIKKIKDLRSKGFSLREIAEMLKIERKEVEIALERKEVLVQPVPAVIDTSEKKATVTKKTKTKRK